MIAAFEPSGETDIAYAIAGFILGASSLSEDEITAGILHTFQGVEPDDVLRGREIARTMSAGLPANAPAAPSTFKPKYLRMVIWHMKSGFAVVGVGRGPSFERIGDFHESYGSALSHAGLLVSSQSKHPTIGFYDMRVPS